MKDIESREEILFFRSENSILSLVSNIQRLNFTAFEVIVIRFLTSSFRKC